MGAEPLIHPLQILLLLIVCTLLMVVAGLRLMATYMEGAVSLLELTIYAILVLGALGAMLGRWGTLPGVLFGVLFVALCLGLPMLQRILDQRLAARLLREDVAHCVRLLQFDPRNAEAHMRLGDVYMRLGHVDEAVAQYQQAIELTPQDRMTQRALQRAIERRRHQEVGSRFCPRCRTENPGAALYCRQCATPMG